MIDLASPQRVIITATRFQHYRILHKKFIHDTRKSCLSLPGFQLRLLPTPSMEKGIERMSLSIQFQTRLLASRTWGSEMGDLSYVLGIEHCIEALYTERTLFWE